MSRENIEQSELSVFNLLILKPVVYLSFTYGALRGLLHICLDINNQFLYLFLKYFDLNVYNNIHLVSNIYKHNCKITSGKKKKVFFTESKYQNY